VILHHVTRLDGVFQNLNDGTPNVTGAGCLAPIRFVVRNNNANIHDRCVIDTEALLPQQRPLSLMEIATLEIHRSYHQQTVIMRMRRAIFATGDFNRSYPTHPRPTPQLGESLPCFAHEIERCSQLRYFAIANRQGHEEEASIGEVFHQTRKCLVDFRLPAERSPPLAHGTVPDPAKPGVLQLQFRRRVFLGRVAGKFENLATVCDPLSIPVVSSNRTAGVHLAHIVGFASVAVPRLIFG